MRIPMLLTVAIAHLAAATAPQPPILAATVSLAPLPQVMAGFDRSVYAQLTGMRSATLAMLVAGKLGELPQGQALAAPLMEVLLGSQGARYDLFMQEPPDPSASAYALGSQSVAGMRLNVELGRQAERLTTALAEATQMLPLDPPPGSMLRGWRALHSATMVLAASSTRLSLAAGVEPSNSGVRPSGSHLAGGIYAGRIFDLYAPMIADHLKVRREDIDTARRAVLPDQILWTLDFIPQGTAELWEIRWPALGNATKPVDQEALRLLPADSMVILAAGCNAKDLWRRVMLPAFEFAALMRNAETGGSATAGQLIDEASAALRRDLPGMEAGVESLIQSQDGTSALSLSPNPDPAQPFPVLSMVWPRNAIADRMLESMLAMIQQTLPIEGGWKAIPLPGTPLQMTLHRREKYWYATTAPGAMPGSAKPQLIGTLPPDTRALFLVHAPASLRLAADFIERTGAFDAESRQRTTAFLLAASRILGAYGGVLVGDNRRLVWHSHGPISTLALIGGFFGVAPLIRPVAIAAQNRNQAMILARALLQDAEQHGRAIAPDWATLRARAKPALDPDQLTISRSRLDGPHFRFFRIPAAAIGDAGVPLVVQHPATREGNHVAVAVANGTGFSLRPEAAQLLWDAAGRSKAWTVDELRTLLDAARADEE